MLLLYHAITWHSNASVPLSVGDATKWAIWKLSAKLEEKLKRKSTMESSCYVCANTAIKILQPLFYHLRYVYLLRTFNGDVTGTIATQDERDKTSKLYPLTLFRKSKSNPVSIPTLETLHLCSRCSLSAAFPKAPQMVYSHGGNERCSSTASEE